MGSHDELNSPPMTATGETERLLPGEETKAAIDGTDQKQEVTASQLFVDKQSNPELRSLHSTTTSQNQVCPLFHSFLLN